MTGKKKRKRAKKKSAKQILNEARRKVDHTGFSTVTGEDYDNFIARSSIFEGIKDFNNDDPRPHVKKRLKLYKILIDDLLAEKFMDDTERNFAMIAYRAMVYLYNRQHRHLQWAKPKIGSTFRVRLPDSYKVVENKYE